jgi:PAS domain-containing protein
LSNTDIGRPISHFATELQNVKLKDLAEKVLENLSVQEDNVHALDNRIFKIRVLPYRTVQNVIDGVVITFEDITARKRVEKEVGKRQILLEAVMEYTNDGIITCDAHGVLSYFNRVAQEFHGLPAKPIPAVKWADHYDLYDEDGTTRMKEENLPLIKALNGQAVTNQICVIAPKGKPARRVEVNGRRLIDSDGRILGAMVSMVEAT